MAFAWTAAAKDMIRFPAHSRSSRLENLPGTHVGRRTDPLGPDQAVSALTSVAATGPSRLLERLDEIPRSFWKKGALILPAISLTRAGECGIRTRIRPFQIRCIPELGRPGWRRRVLREGRIARGCSGTPAGTPVRHGVRPLVSVRSKGARRRADEASAAEACRHLTVFRGDA